MAFDLNLPTHPVFGVLDQLTGGGAAANKKALADNEEMWGQLQTLSPEELTYTLDGYVQQGIVTPEQAQLFLQQKSDLSGLESQMGGIVTDPKLIEAQQRALSSLQEIGEGGLTAQDRADLSRIRSEEATAEKGARDAIIQGAQMRGVGGGGLELLSQMQSQQASANRTSQRDLDVAGMAQQRALEALQQAGSLAGNQRQQGFSEQSQVASAQDQLAMQKAQAQDAISRFNAQQRTGQNVANVAAANDAAAANLAAQQAAANSRIDAANKTKAVQAQAKQSAYDSNLGKLTAISNARAASGNNAQAQTRDNQGILGGVIQSGASMFSDKTLKEDVKPFSAAEFLDGLTGYKYKYKADSGLPQGPQAGVMAQDMEKVAPEAVGESEGKKTIDYGKLAGPLLASLLDVHNRVKELESKKKGK